MSATPKTQKVEVIELDGAVVITLRRDIAERAGLSAGSSVDVQAADGQIIIGHAKNRLALEDRLAGMAPEREHPLED